VEIVCDVTPHEVRYQITDEGPGFDVALVPDPRDEDRIDIASGRGLLMMRAFMDEVIFNDQGNQVTLVKRRAPQSAMAVAEPLREVCAAG
jgi:anti-sigma regulatory factor (Ser/Thr protein kinase)